MTLQKQLNRATLAMLLAAPTLYALTNSAARMPAPPPPTGQTLFENRCARCHGLNGDGGEGLAPALTGIVGRPAAGDPHFLYSKALKAKGGTWTPEALDRYIADPQAEIPGSEMDSHSPDPAERQAIVKYLTTLK